MSDDSKKTVGTPGMGSNQAAPGKVQALIGARIRIKGELYGEEDILIQGRVEGTIHVKENSLTVGKEGTVAADSTAKQITVEGEVKGDLTGEEVVAIRNTANVTGNIISPRVSLEDGAKFKGMIDMDPASVKATAGRDGPSSVTDLPTSSSKPGDMAPRNTLVDKAAKAGPKRA